MQPRQILLMILVAAIWGFNFVPIRVGLNHMPPLVFIASRFLFTVFPAIFFIKKPAVPWSRLALYGVVTFGGQFGFCFAGIQAGLSPGLAALMMQLSVFFTIGLAALLLRERPLLFQIIGAVVAFGGIVVVAIHKGSDVTSAGLAFVVIAALCASCGNLITKTLGQVDMLAVIVWGHLFALLFVAPLAWAVDGEVAIRASVLGMNTSALLALAYVCYASTFIAYSTWNVMLSRHPTAMIVPFTLLVPVFAMASASLLLGESYPLWKFLATILIIFGLVLNQFGEKFLAWCGWRLRPNPALD